MYNNDIEPIFLLSLPRSGSTLLQKILMSHSKISSTAECWFLLPLVYSYKTSGTLSAYSHITTYTAIKDMINILPNKEQDYYRFLGEFASKIYSNLSSPNSEYYLDKTPRYYLIIPELIKMFPKAKFIFLFRNPVQIFASFISTYGNNRFKMFQSNVNYQGIINGPKLLSDGYESLKENSYGIQYEEFITDPQKHLKDLLHYLNLEYEEEMLEKFYSQDLKGNYYDPNGAKYKNEIVKTTLAKWKNVFNSNYRKAVIKNYLKNIDNKTLSIQGYNKNEILKDISTLKTNGKHNLFRDFIDFNCAKIKNKAARLSFD